MEGEKDDSCIVETIQMREKGNKLYREEKYSEAIDVWFESLKSSLKSSVRFASPKLYENQFLCRLNLAMAYLKLENWIDAKEQSQLVLEQQPKNVKALLRLARAYEGLQEWEKCEEFIRVIVQCINEFKQNRHTQDTCQECILSDQDDALNGVHMFGLTPEYVLHYINGMRKRICKEEKLYFRKKTKMLQTIGSQICERGNRYRTNKFVNDSLSFHPEEDMTKEIFFLSLTYDHIFQWTHQADTKWPVHFSPGPLQYNSSLIQGFNFHEKEGLFKDDSSTLNNTLDDPNSSLWTRHDKHTKEKHRCISAVSLPLSILYILSLIFGVNPHGFQDHRKPMFSLDDWLGYDPLSLLRKSLIDAMIYRHQLTFFIIGAKCSEIVNCHWTSLLRRLKRVTRLNIVFIGSTQNDATWETCLGSNNFYTSSLQMTEGTTQQVNGFFYRTGLKNFVSAHSDVLTEKSHALHPDFVCVIQQEYEKKKAGEGIEDIQKVDFYTIPIFTLSTCSSQETFSSDVVSSDTWENGEMQWIVPFQKNPYSVEKHVVEEFSSVEECESSDRLNTHMSNISLLNGAVGCLMKCSSY